jgi:hypothetical protein
MENFMNRSAEEVKLGLELHETETAIAIGKQAVGEILMTEPIDQDALSQQRLQVHEARLARNALRDQLEQAKTSGIPQYRWH